MSTKTLLNSPDCYGNVCLHLAIKHGHREVGTDNCHSNLILEIDQSNYSSEKKITYDQLDLFPEGSSLIMSFTPSLFIELDKHLIFSADRGVMFGVWG